MAARLDQLLGMVADEIRRSDYEGLLPAGVVLVGGVAGMPGIENLALHKLNMNNDVGGSGTRGSRQERNDGETMNGFHLLVGESGLWRRA